MAASYERDIEQCLSVLRNGGVILFPTDTIWGLGCDATNEQAVHKVLQIKERQAAQGLIVLLANAEDISLYARPAAQEVWETIVQQQQKPTTIIYEEGKDVAGNILPPDKTLGIRIVQDDFCRMVISRFGKPVVSTSANIHGRPSPQNFAAIEDEVIKQVDYVVRYRQEETSMFQPSAILKLRPDGFEVIRP